MIQPIISTTLIAFVFLFGGCDISSKDSTNVQLREEPEGIHAAFYNSDGSKISMSTTRGRLILADSNLNIVVKSKGHKGHANSSFFSLDDKYIITGGEDRSLNVWNAATLESDRKYQFSFNSWTSIHGYYTLGGCGEKGQVIFYNKRSHDTIRFLLEPEGAFHLYYLLPDTSFVVSSGYSGYEINLQKKKIVHCYKGHSNWVYCIMPDNAQRRIVTASKDSTVKIFDRFTQSCLYTSPNLRGPVYVSCFNNKDNVIAASTGNGEIYFMDTTLATIKMKIKAFETRINTIHYSPDGTRMVVGSEGGGAKIFSVKDGSLLYELKY